MTTAIIGIDGATFRVIDEHRKSLPTFDVLMSNGYSSTLRSTDPPTTSVAWPAFATGRNPGAYGIYDFMNRDPKSMDFFLNDARERLEEFFWQYMDESTGLGSIPIIPYHSVDGFFIQGSLARINEDQITDPPSLADHIPRDYDYRIDWRDDNSEIVAGVKRRVEARKQFFLDLVRTYDLGCYFLMFNAVDHIQHHFWAYMDDTHPAHQDSPHEETILDIYRAVDDAVGAIIDELPDDTNVILASDHGFMRNEMEINLNALLSERGYLKFNVSASGSVLTTLHDTVKKYLSYEQITTLLPKTLQDTLRSQMPINENIHEAIDWDRTQAYSFGVMPNIYVNLQGRESTGTVSQDEYNSLLEELSSMLLSLTDSNGERMFEEVKYGSDIYDGPFEDTAPDIILIPAEGRYCKGNIGDRVFSKKTYPMPNSGVHEHDGIFVAAGPDVEPNDERPDGSHDIVDVAPTVLQLNGYNPPDSFDGTAIEAAIGRADGDLRPADRAERRRIADRVLAMKQLGYI